MDCQAIRPREGAGPARGVVWYPAGFSGEHLLATLPDDLEARRLLPGEPPVFRPDEAGVVIMDAADDTRSVLAISAVRGVKLPVVALLEPGQSAPVDASDCMYLTEPVAPVTLASVLRAACAQARLTREAQQAARQFEELNAIGIRLSAERDTTRLLDLILTTARTITQSDAGSIYLIETRGDGSRQLRFELAHNESVPVGFGAVTLPLTRESLAGHVALSGEMLHVDDAYLLPPSCAYRFNPEFDARAGYRTKSMLVVPMQTPSGDVIGVLELINCKRESGRPFTSSAEIAPGTLPYPPPFQSLAASLASQAAVALANSDLFRELRGRHQRLEALVDVSQRVTHLWPPETLQRRIAELYGTLLQADGVAFHLLEGTTLRLETAWGESVEAVLPAGLAIDEGPAGRVAATGDAVAILELGSHERLTRSQQEAARCLGLRAWLSVPVRASDRVVGVLSALTGQVPAFSPDDIAVATTFAAQAGIAVENSRLYGELQRALEGVKKSQDQLVQVERLRALGEMAAGVAHDFNNLLAVVMLRAELVLARQQAPEVAESLAIIRQAAEDGAQTVRRIQEFTRTRSIRPFARVNVRTLLRDVVELSRPRWRDQAQSRGVTYDVQVEGGAVPLVAGAAEELREAFLNLLNNALEAMPGGGRVSFSLAADGDRVVIRAADTGCGMSEETRRRVFEPFFTTKGVQGNGLGLAVVWGIVARHRGEIEVESTLGTGTVFTVRLPIPTALPAEPGADAAPSVPAGKRVLLVEDNVEILKSLSEVLSEHGCQVVAAPNGATALARCGPEPVDLVLTDLAMPGMSGWEVAAACRERFPEVPVGLITGFGNQLEPAKIEQHGVKFVVAKPFSAGDLLREVAGVLQPGGTS